MIRYPIGVVDTTLCDQAWILSGEAKRLTPCSVEINPGVPYVQGAVAWPTVLHTESLQLSFTVTISNTSDYPADGFAVVLGDATLGAKPTEMGIFAHGMGAEGIPGVAFVIDTFQNEGEPAVPYFGITRGEAAQWENPWLYVNKDVPTVAKYGQTIAHKYTYTFYRGKVDITMDGVSLYSGNLAVPSAAYLFVTGSTGQAFEQTDLSEFSVNEIYTGT